MISKNIWVLTHQRSGSSYFCSIVNQLLNINLNEYFLDKIVLENYKIDLSWCKDIETWKKFLLKLEDFNSIKNLLPSCNKIHYSQYQQYELFDVKKYLKKMYPDIVFIILERNNKIAAAVSAYIAEYTNIWAVHTIDNYNRFTRINIPYNFNRIKNFYNLFLDIKNKWIEHFLYEDHYYYITYEQFEDNQKNISDLIGIKNSIINRHIKQVHPKSLEFIERFSNEINNFYQ